MGAHNRTPAEVAALHARIVELRREGLEASVIATRLGISVSMVGIVVRAAIKRGENVPPLKQPPTPGMKRGRPTGGIGRAHDLGWDRCGGTGRER